MTRNDLSDTAKRRLKPNTPCPICTEIIKDDDKILCIVKRKRRFKQYTFYHERCLVDGEKEKTIQE